jgi:glutamyl-tRNA synthetase
LHIGGLRTALYNYLLARKTGGIFVLRIEDTDQKRYVEGAEAYIMEALEWCGISPDEGPQKGGNYGPYRQSERQEIYAVHVKTLLANG